MRVIKLYRNPNHPEFYSLVRVRGENLLVNYPIDKPYSKQSARWFNFSEVYIDWIREFKHD
jgi:hypothetical protein